MALQVNTFALQQTTIHSSRLGVLGMIAHQMPEEGTYAVNVFQNEVETGELLLSVSKSHPNTQVDIDLSKLQELRDTGCGCDKTDLRSGLELGANGYIVLYVSKGAGGFHVLLSKLGEGGRRTVEYDSRNLIEGDQFIATLLRPGMYDLLDEVSQATGKIVVNYPKIGRTPYRPADPVLVVVAKDSFKPAEITLGPAQAVSFSIQSHGSSILISLTERDDGPDNDHQKVRWNNPAAKNQP